MDKWWRRPCPVACLVAVLLALAHILSQPCFCLYVQGTRLAAVPARAGLPFTIQFRHSVQKTPVWENLQVEADGSLTLLSTRYQSFGVGLPFLEGEGDFREEGDYFIFDHMDRHFPQLTLRTGVGTRLTLTVAGREYRLYEQYAPGTRVDLVVLPLWRLALWRPTGN